MTEKAVKNATLRRQGLLRGRTNLEEHQALVLPKGAIYRAFGRELAARLAEKQKEKGNG